MNMLNLFTNISDKNIMPVSATTTLQKKDIYKPKGIRPASSFFQRDNRSRISLDYPRCSSKEVDMICNKLYTSLPQKVKCIYIAMHQADMMRFEQETQEMKEAMIERDERIGGIRFTPKEQKKFYKLRSCFRISKENKGLPFGLVAKMCDKEWYALDATEKKKNHDMLEAYKKKKLGKPYSFIPWLWSIALFHHTLVSSTLLHQFLQL
jgi:hypothetical protein